MIATLDDGGWETVANVQFQTIPNQITDEKGTVPPPPEFSAVDNQQQQNGTNNIKEDSSRPSRQYVYGDDSNVGPVKVVDSNMAKCTHANENVIEAEIREQRIRDETIRKQRSTEETIKGDRVSSPSSHSSDEGFVDRPNEDVTEGYTRIATKPIDAVVYTSKGCVNNSPPVTTSEAKIALEIRELREREDELRAMRELQKKQLLTIPLEEDERSSSSSREATDDHLVSLITTTDEGNYSECGDHILSEDKSSDGSNSRIMSPDLLPYGSSEMRQRRVTVKPYEDDDIEDQQPVYTRMKKESVIEREIRLGKERDEAYRREKGLLSIVKPVRDSVTVKASNSSASNCSGCEINARKISSRSLTSSIIQQEIAEDYRKEKELKSSGHIMTLSQDTDEPNDYTAKFKENSRNDHSYFTPLSINTSKSGLHRQFQKCPTSPNQFTPPSMQPTQTRMMRSLSTTNLSAPFSGSLSNGLRPPKGLMQKFIASKGKITAQTFVSTMQPTRKLNGTPVFNRSTSLTQKMSVARSETERKLETGKPTTRIYKRTQLTAEEKIQGELREMKKREEELKRLRAKGIQSHTADVGIEEYSDDSDTYTLPEINNLRTALSNPNLLDCDQPIVAPSDKQARRKSILIAQWEDRIQQTNES